MVMFKDGRAQEATTVELIQFAEKSADYCKIGDFTETMFRLGNRGIERSIGLKLIKRFEDECICHDHWADYSDDPQDY